MTIVDAPRTPASDWRMRLRKARRVVENEGISRLPARFLCWSVSRHLDMGKLQFFARDLTAPLPEEAPTPSDLRLRPAREDELEKILRAGNPGHDRKLLQGRFDRGDRCFVAVDDRDEIGHCRWVTTGEAYVPELEADVVLGPRQAYMYDGFTRKDMRRRGIDGMIRCFIFRSMREAGHASVHSCVRGDNPGGLRAARRWQQPTGHVWHMRFRRLGRALRLPLRMPASIQIAPRDDAASGSDERSWRRWFESWTDKPLESRSTGFSALPEAYFLETADYIRETLELSPTDDDVLDVGCDSAMLSRHVAPACRSLVGVDFIRDLLADPAETPATGSGNSVRFVNADGRRLPFPDDAYDKVYCAGMLHTLPEHTDGLQVLRELVRVCKPGGAILVAALPDRNRRRERIREAWRRGDTGTRLRLLTALAAPNWLKRAARRWGLLADGDRLVALEYDLEKLQETLAAAGLPSHVLDFPASYWSRDFRRTRSNLLIRVPEEEAS